MLALVFVGGGGEGGAVTSLHVPADRLCCINNGAKPQIPIVSMPSHIDAMRPRPRTHL